MAEVPGSMLTVVIFVTGFFFQLFCEKLDCTLSTTMAKKVKLSWLLKTNIMNLTGLDFSLRYGIFFLHENLAHNLILWYLRYSLVHIN